ncbi:Hypothetical protein PHPALM_555 [Phytophthora palmivora]|uniref:Uncharacterized protein n=1 Tax=Phytophthora palmivora TaxID=4796 RepID=A0A2P4YUL8_9STRA|nr:Hypothetical protein PHPALM_555 [Phytophthora palmivora]
MVEVLDGCYYPASALAFSMLRKLKKMLSNPLIFPEQAVLVGHQEFIQQNFSLRWIKRLSIGLVWISFLDPRFHKMKLLTQDEVQIARERLLEAGGGFATIYEPCPHWRGVQVTLLSVGPPLMIPTAPGAICGDRVTKTSTRVRELTLRISGYILHVTLNLRLIWMKLRLFHESRTRSFGELAMITNTHLSDCSHGSGSNVWLRRYHPNKRFQLQGRQSPLSDTS